MEMKNFVNAMLLLVATAMVAVGCADPKEVKKNSEEINGIKTAVELIENDITANYRADTILMKSVLGNSDKIDVISRGYNSIIKKLNELETKIDNLNGELDARD